MSDTENLEMNGAEELEKSYSASEPLMDTPVEKTKDTVGVVTGCLMLNIRKESSVNSTKLCEIPALSEVKVLVSDSTKDFYKVITDSEITGYAMRNFITLK